MKDVLTYAIDKTIEELNCLKATLEYVKNEEQKNKQMVNEHRARIHGDVLANAKIFANNKQSLCTHRKGGHWDTGFDGKFPINGTDESYAVIKHQFPWGDVWVICMRCGKKWKPPVKSDYVFKEGISEHYNKDYREYLNALEFSTRNRTSSSSQFNVNVEVARECTKDS